MFCIFTTPTAPAPGGVEKREEQGRMRGEGTVVGLIFDNKETDIIGGHHLMGFCW